MQLSAPKQTTWWVAVLIGVAGIAANFVTIPVVSDYSFWLVAVSFVILVLGTFFKGL